MHIYGRLGTDRMTATTMTMRTAAETMAKLMGQEGVHLTINKVLRWWIAEDGRWGKRKRWCGDCGNSRTMPTTNAVANTPTTFAPLPPTVLLDGGGKGCSR